MAEQMHTQFEPEPALLTKFAECMADFGEGEDAPEADWPNNILSKKTVVYGSGVIARQGDPVRHNVSADELALCRRLAAEAFDIMKQINAGLNTEADISFQEFYLAANADTPAPEHIDEALIRSKFGGTIFPLAAISVEPLDEQGGWWSEVLTTASGIEEDEEDDEALYGEEDGEAGDNSGYAQTFLNTWRSLLRWFRETPEFKERAFVRIGDYDALRKLERENVALPPGTRMMGSVFPRLLIGLTHNGSLAGLFTYIVLT